MKQWILDLWGRTWRSVDNIPRPEWMGIPIVSSLSHGVITFLGLWPLPLGLIGFGLGLATFLTTGFPYFMVLWPAGVTYSAVGYTYEEMKEHGGYTLPMLPLSDRYNTWLKRQDPRLDVIFPYLAAILAWTITLLWLI